MIEARGLTKRYGVDTLALEDVHFTVGPGEIFCLLGSAGAGKTTLINLFWSAVRPTRGAALIDGFDAALHALAVKQAATIIAATASLDARWTARKNVTFLARVAGARASRNRKRIEHAMRRMGVRDRDFDQPVHALPPRVRPLLWLAFADVRETGAVLWDEPTRGLTPRAASDVQDGLRQLRQEGKAILLVTSDVALATTVADRVGILKAGRLAAERTKSDLLGQNLTQFYVDYTGRPHPPWSDLSHRPS